MAKVKNEGGIIKEVGTTSANNNYDDHRINSYRLKTIDEGHRILGQKAQRLDLAKIAIGRVPDLLDLYIFALSLSLFIQFQGKDAVFVGCFSAIGIYS